jgi:inosine-uridine nucleoside N-ribohydrolase
MIVETDIGRDADDLFSLIYLYNKNIKIDAITITPGDPDQIAVVKCLNNIFNRYIPVGIPDLSRNKSSSNPFHQKFISRHGHKTTEQADGVGVDILKQVRNFDDLIVLGPCTNIGRFFTEVKQFIPRMTMQGGFLPCNTGKFKGMECCPTFNLNGDILNGLNFINHEWTSTRRMVGKNVGHFKCIWTKDRKFDNELLQDTFNLFSKYNDSKKLQDPMATVCHLHPEIGTWIRGKTVKVKGGWSTDLNNPSDYILSDIDQDKFWEIYNAN